MNHLSVIIPHYNSSKYFKLLLNKLIYQKETYYPETEIIVIDDKSTEDISWLKEFEDKSKIIYLSNNHGVSHARNIGLEYCTGDYIQFVDSDDDISDDFLHIIYENIRTNCDYCIYYWKYGKDGITGGEIPEDSLSWNLAVWGYTFNRRIIEGHKFDENLKIGEDIKFLHEIIKPEMNRTTVNKAIYHYNTDNRDSLCHRNWNQETER